MYKKNDEQIGNAKRCILRAYRSFLHAAELVPLNLVNNYYTCKLKKRHDIKSIKVIVTF